MYYNTVGAVWRHWVWWHVHHVINMLRVHTEHLLHPGLFQLHCVVHVTVTVTYRNVVKQSDSYNLRDICDSFRYSGKKLQSVFHCGENITFILCTVYKGSWNKSEPNQAAVWHWNELVRCVNVILPVDEQRQRRRNKSNFSSLFCPHRCVGGRSVCLCSGVDSFRTAQPDLVMIYRLWWQTFFIKWQDKFLGLCCFMN